MKVAEDLRYRRVRAIDARIFHRYKVLFLDQTRFFHLLIELAGIESLQKAANIVNINLLLYNRSDFPYNF
ncbi:hypothetical protein L0152_07330 [bacterium]|nr:hypothetical protein [bacterium]